MPITNKSPVSATNSKESPAAPAKPDEKKPAEAVKAATDSKAAPAAPAKPDEKKPNEATKTASDNKAAPAALAKSDEKKPAEAVKTATDNKIAPAVPAKPDEKKPNEAAKTAADSKAAPVATAKPDEKKTAEAVKTATDSKAAPAAPVKPDEKKPAEANKAAMDSKAAPATPAKPDEKKPTEAVKTATDSKTAPAVPAKPDEKKPVEAAKTVTDTKAAPTAPAKPDEKKPTEANKVVNFPTSAGESKPEKAAAPTEDEYNDPKDVRLSIGAVETDKITSMKISEMHRFEGHPFILVSMPDLYQQAIVDAVQSLRQLSYAQMLILASDEAVEGILRAGADNCLPLETGAERAVEHARAMIRRYTLYNHYDLARPDASVIYRGELMIDPLRRRVTMAGEEIALQRREFKLLQHFAENPGIVLTADQIGELLWGAEYDYNRKLSPVIAELRRKIHDTSRPSTYIETVHGVGYRFLPNK